jgi:hypothetical protein
MNNQYGSALPYYVGRRTQRGGGFISSLARFAMPMAKKFFTETFKAAPGVLNAMSSKNTSAGEAILGGIKRAGMNTAKDTFTQLQNSMGGDDYAPTPKRRRALPVRVARKRTVNPRRKPTPTRRRPNDIFN